MSVKSSKSLYSTCFTKYKLTSEQLLNLQHELLKMLIDVKNICDSNNIDYMLSGGTLLGAIRHKGFIPWDDDIDIMMTRNEYDKFKVCFEAAFKERYQLTEPLSSPRYVSKMVKIYKKNTLFVEIPTAGVHGADMMFIDLFIIENVPSPGLTRKIKSVLYDIAFKASSVCVDYKYPSPIIEDESKNNKELNAYYSSRKRLGALFSHLGGMKFYLSICERIANQKKRTGWYGVPSAISYSREVFPCELFEEIGTAEFCGYEVKIPQNYDAYLKNLYGNYMEVPPPEKREVHSAYKIIFDTKKG